MIRNNILDRLRPPLAATIENNIFLRQQDAGLEGSGAEIVADQQKLFMDPDKGDYRRGPGGTMMSAGASIPPPSATWKGR